MTSPLKNFYFAFKQIKQPRITFVLQSYFVDGFDGALNSSAPVHADTNCAKITHTELLTKTVVASNVHVNLQLHRVSVVHQLLHQFFSLDVIKLVEGLMSIVGTHSIEDERRKNFAVSMHSSDRRVSVYSSSSSLSLIVLSTLHIAATHLCFALVYNLLELISFEHSDLSQYQLNKLI